MLAVQIGEKYTIEEWKKKMESEGWLWKDFDPDTIDPEGTKYRNWFSNNRRKYLFPPHHLWHIKAPGLVFYKPNPDYVPTPDHPLKGQGPFKAIYLHELYPMSEFSLVEAEIININAKIRWLDGAPINIDHTTPTRLIKYDSTLYKALQDMRQHELNMIQRWKMVLSELQLSQMQSPMSHATSKPLDASNGRRIPVESRSDSERDRPMEKGEKE